MAKEEFSVAVDTSKMLDLIGILKESLKIPLKNLKLMVSVMLLLLIPFSLLALNHDLVAGPFLIEIEDQESDSGWNFSTSRVQKDIRILVGLESVYFIAFCVLIPFTMTATMYASATTYTGKHLSLMDVCLKIIEIWKRPMITWLYVLLITAVYAFIVVMVFVAFALITNGGTLIAMIGLVSLPAMIFFVYLAAVWMLGLVISVVEEDCYGMKAIKKAVYLIKGRKLQGFGLMMVLALLIAPISVLFSLNTIEDDIEPVVRLAIGAIETVLASILKLFAFVVYTVFYYECKNSHGGKVEMEDEERCGLVSTNLYVNHSLP
ncbi:uncharacterized protein LOC131256125 [Magnolia sinica]|uniref:uncharacterized protein LOC131256125 n=1 Tax=Magnolia sinica TaxID=86752 RepID=UPI002659C8A0|nr:uncharacterized protein LOC131256125 [Magnolia sinica]